MKKQTAVEWLQEQLQKGVDFNPLDKNSYLNNVEKLFNQAKAMEKEQIEIAFEQGENNSVDYFIPEKGIKESEQYYNQEYGGDK